MTLMWAEVVVSFVVLAALIVYLRRRSRNKLFGMREDAHLEHLRAMSNMNVPNTLFEEVFQTIAGEIGIRPGQLRPSDRFTEIFKVDSWQLGGAQDAVEDLIQKKQQTVRHRSIPFRTYLLGYRTSKRGN
jgi:hypothetical protein